MYLCQSVRVKWNKYVSDVCPVTNGVKQGGVLSPILFVNYIDELFTRLRGIGVGCHIGGKFCGGFGYADDVTLLAPTRNSLKCLLSECISFAKEFDLLFNVDKSKYLIFDKSPGDVNGNIVFDGINLCNVDKDFHLGNVLGKSVNKDRIFTTVSDFYRRFNLFYSSFSDVNTSVKYLLFKTYCMPLYGSQLWDFSSKDCQLFYIAWRKAVRRLLGIDNKTHNHLLHLLCDDAPVDVQLHKRFMKFFHKAINSTNFYTNLCARLALNGSHSAVANSLTFVSFKYQLYKYRMSGQSLHDVLNQVNYQIDDSHLSTAGAILDFINLRDKLTTTSGDKIKIDEIILNLCTA